MVHRPHPLNVTLGKVIVDGDDVDAAAGEGVQVGRQRGHERLTLARLHLGDFALFALLAFMEHNSAHDLLVEVAHVEVAPGSFAYCRERLGADVVEVVAPGKQDLELIGLGPQLLVRELLELRLQIVDGLNVRPEPLEDPVATAGDEVCHGLEHTPVLPKARPQIGSSLVYYNE